MTRILVTPINIMPTNAVRIVDTPCFTTSISLFHLKFGNLKLINSPRHDIKIKLLMSKEITCKNWIKFKFIFKQLIDAIIKPGTNNNKFKISFTKLISKIEIGSDFIIQIFLPSIEKAHVVVVVKSKHEVNII